MPQKLISIATYTYATEAYVLIAKLEAEGIKTFLKNEHLLATQQFLSNAIGGLDVQVDEEDVEAANVVVKKVEAIKKDASGASRQIPTNFEKVFLFCPECESSEIYRKKTGFFTFGNKEHYCMECNYGWKQ